jgi:hypothetical protein
MNALIPSTVIPGLVPGIHVFAAMRFHEVDGRNKCGHGVRCGTISGRTR